MSGILQNVLSDGLDVFRLVVAGTHRDEKVEISDGFLPAA